MELAVSKLTRKDGKLVRDNEEMKSSLTLSHEHAGAFGCLALWIVDAAANMVQW